jgi:hypothetical protein
MLEASLFGPGPSITHYRHVVIRTGSAGNVSVAFVTLQSLMTTWPAVLTPSAYTIKPAGG